MRSSWCYEPPAPWDGATPPPPRTSGGSWRRTGTSSATTRSILERMLSEAPKKRGARYREVVLRHGDRVAILGEAVQEPDPTAVPAGLRQPVFRVVIGEPPDPGIVSNEPGAWS